MSYRPFINSAQLLTTMSFDCMLKSGILDSTVLGQGPLSKTGIFIARTPGIPADLKAGFLQRLKVMRVSYKGGEVQDENSSAVRGNHQMDCQGKLNQ
jgi:hypothetical protein